MTTIDGPDTMVRLPSPPLENAPPDRAGQFVDRAAPFVDRTDQFVDRAGQFVDNMQRNRPFHRISSQESANSWSAAESHMTSHMTDHMTSDIEQPTWTHGPFDRTRGPESAHLHHDRGRRSGGGSAGNVRSDWSSALTNQLSPLHEHQVMDSDPRLHRNWNQTQTAENVAMRNFHQSQHSSQPFLSRNHSPSPPPLPTSLPPPLSSLPQHARSMDHILNHTTTDARMDVGPVSHSHTQFQNHDPQPRLGMQNGPPNMPRSASPEYAEPKLVRGGQRRNEQRQQQTQKMLAVPLKSKSKRSKNKQSSPPPDVLPPQIPEKKSAQLQSVVASNAPPQPPLLPVKTKTLTSLPGGHHPPPSLSPHTQTVSPDQGSVPHPATAPQPPHPSNGLKDVLTQWKLQQESQERERQHPLAVGYPNPVGLQDMPHGLTLAVQGTTTSAPSSHSSQIDRWTTTPSPPEGIGNHIQNSETPIVKNAPPVFKTPANQTSNRHHHREAAVRGQSRKNRELEDIYQSDPRKPQRKKGRVPGAVWKQMPMNSRIESSSSEESESDDSLTSEYV